MDTGAMAILQRVTKSTYLGLGFLCVCLGVIGIVVPVMPTTIFLILAVGCFAKSDPRYEQMLLEHPRVGPTLTDWQRTKSIRLRTKFTAIGTIILVFSLSISVMHTDWVKILLGGIGLAVCLYIGTRKTKRD